MSESNRQMVLDRFGTVLRRAPYVSAAVTTAALLMVWFSAYELDPGTSRPWLDWAVVVWSAYAVLASLVLLPKVVIPRARLRQSDEQIAPMRWSFAAAPSLAGFATFGAGADAWALHVAMVVSVVLVFLAARTIRASAPT